MPDETNIPACLGCDHQAPDHCEMCGGKLGTGGLPPCTYCNQRGNPPVEQLSIVSVSDSIVDIQNGVYRLEKSPATLTMTATEEILSDDITAGKYKVGGIDAVNKPIVLGEEFTFHDWKGHFSPTGWAAYFRDESGVYRRIGFGQNQAEAMGVVAVHMMNKG